MIENTVERYIHHLELPVFYPNIFTPEECKRIVEIAKKERNLPFQKAMEKIYEKKVDVKGMIMPHQNPESLKFISRVQKVAIDTNNNHFKFDASYFSPVFILEYLKDSFAYNHVDISRSDNTFPKMNILIFLSDPNDYQGGRIVWQHLPPEIMNTYKQEQGTMVMFPSFLCHNVEPIISGERYSYTNMYCSNNSFR
ncbi:MAG: 2OG-Fe(II) oxygenase [Candidatus Sericytochromatia bacterium]|nr:2OG-Fe(II) oxygenase [Candidatus Sericytochromatia bacterium]